MSTRPLPLLSPVLIAAVCVCGKKPPAPAAQTEVAGSAALGAAASASPASGSDASAPPPIDVSAFSAPIAAVRLHGIDVVAGLIAADGAIRASAFAGGRAAWTTDVLRDVKWTRDADLRLLAAGDRVAVVWSGLRQSKPVRTLVQLDARGAPVGEPSDIGAAFCATQEGLAWVGPRAAGGSAPIRARRWSDPGAVVVLSVPREREPSLICGEHDVMVLGDGADDLDLSRFSPGDASAQPHVVVLRDADFTDEEREHDAYSVGDDIGLVRVGASGGVSVRIVPKAEQPGRWRRLKHSLSDDDEVVAVDGDPGAALLVVTHEREDACGGRGSAEGVRAIRVDMRGDDDAVFELAPADCERAPGPFWISSTGSEQVVAWVERRPPGGLPRSAPIRGVAFRVVRPDGARASRILQAADAVVDAGCDDTGCSLAALVRPPDSDGMQPAPIRLFAYPR